MTGEMKRSSDPRPLVASHQRRTIAPMAPAPRRRPVNGGGDRRSVRTDGFDFVSSGIWCYESDLIGALNRGSSDTEEAESTGRISHRDTETQRFSVSRCLCG